MKSAFVLLLVTLVPAVAFVPAAPRARVASLRAEPETEAPAKEKALEAKMAAWEATEEEQRKATLGGLVPGSSGKDGFDIGLWLAFPPLFGALLIFLLFPFISNFVDITDVGAPPTV